MILRRLFKNFAAQNWFIVGLDLLVVVTGIFLGMQVTNWNVERQNRVTESVYLERLHEDMQENIHTFKENIRIYEGFVADISATLIMAEERRSLDDKTREFLTATIPMNSAWRHLVMELGTIEELIASGDMNIIKSAAIKKRLVGVLSRSQSMSEQLAYYKDWYLANERDIFAGLNVRVSAETLQQPGRKPIGALTAESAELTRSYFMSRIDEKQFFTQDKVTALTKMWGARNAMLSTLYENLEYIRETDQYLLLARQGS